MGLDGISINQLGITHDSSTTKITKTINNENQFKIDGLNKGQIVETKKENEHKNSNQNDFFDDNEDDNNANQPQKTDEGAIKYDLSDNTKYYLKIEKDTNSIVIYDKKTKMPLQKISPDTLSEFVNYLSNSKGFKVNRKL